MFWSKEKRGETDRARRGATLAQNAGVETLETSAERRRSDGIQGEMAGLIPA
jgi:hypothetical protein